MATRTVIAPGPDQPGQARREVEGGRARKPPAPMLPQLKRIPKSRLAFFLHADGLGQFELEHRFHPVRKWRIDVAFVAEKLAIEIEGVTPEGSRHQRIAGFRNDIKKYNELTVAGWRLLRFMPEMVSSGYAVNMIKRALEARALNEGVKGAGNAKEERAGQDGARRELAEATP
jgi:very-short-patch-repair endonuclease